MDHINGQCALAIRPRYPNGHSFLGVLDLDASEPTARVAVEAYAAGVISVAQEHGVVVLKEETGGRGMHLWFPLEIAVPADQLAARLDTLLATAGTPGAGVAVERLPGRDDEPDLHSQAMTLPGRIHLETGTRSVLTTPNNEALSVNLNGLRHIDGGDFEAVPDPRPTADKTDTPRGLVGEASWSCFGGEVEKIMVGCILLRDLADRAQNLGHLSHSERLSVLYTLGHLGVRGTQAIHALIRPCANYDPAETERQIGKLSGLPISCSRMREKHVTPSTAPSCTCSFHNVRERGGYPTPLLHVSGFKHQWRKILRSRKDRTSRTIEPATREKGKQPALKVVEEPIPTPPKPVGPAHRPEPSGVPASTERMGDLDCIPPHLWA